MKNLEIKTQVFANPIVKQSNKEQKVHEEELIDKIKNDNHEAFSELINKHKDQVFRVAMGFMHDKSLAEDIVQEVFIKFWEKRKDFELTAKISTYLYRVTTNMSINSAKKSKFSKVFSSIKNKSDETENSQTYEASLNDENQKTIDDNFKQEHIKIAMKKAIDSLAKNQKTAFILSKYQDFSYKEIAKIMELSVSSVESLLHRAKKNLQNKLLNVYNNL